MSDLLLGIDAGGTMVKVTLFDAAGEEVACEHRPNRMTFPRPGWTERDPDAMWRGAAEAVKAVIGKSGTDPRDIAAVTPSGYGAGLFLVDADGAVVRPGLGSTDSRALGLIEDWRRDGVGPRLSDAILQAIWPGQTTALLGWFQRHEPETLARTAHVLACKDFLRYRLTGDISTDPTDAGCAGTLDVAKGAYALEALREAGLGAWVSRLPEIGAATEIAGRITPEAAAETGLLAGTPVARGVYDVVGCSLASGLRHADQLGVVAGTFSINSTLHARPLLDPRPTLQCPYPVGGLYLATIATPTSASNLEWLCKTMLQAEADRALAAGRSIYEVCSDLVEQALDRESGAMFLPYLFGGPDGMPGALVGLTAGASLADVLRAVFEGITLAHRTDVDFLLGGPQSARPTRAVLAGGPSKSNVWSQMFADAIGLPMTVANGSEFGAKGAAMCGAVAVGLRPDLDAAMTAMTRVARSYQPDARRAERLGRQHDRYLQMSRRLSGGWTPVPAPTAASFAGAPA
ncbi:MAG: carbohydrate kinase [Rhodovulum sulfidophilum]|uniref:Carbohydrate kinase n=1 Tax=Rhodovulum sulfidophilum TaxID=35806 RepID=A0A2W5N484_RHOSU|nr:MAG: carbohydrate kinase [Rhodovulum sulfidophilum]